MGTTDTKRIETALKKRFDFELKVPEELPNAGAIAAMNERSVCRNYQSQPLTDEMVSLICASALSAPSKSDLQQADIIRVSDPKIRGAINALLPTSPWIASAPEFLIICGNNRRLRHFFTSRSSQFPNDNLDSFFNAAVDAGIVLATLVQAANLAGLGTCPISEVRNHSARISEMLGLPKWVFPLAGITLGYPVSLEPFSPRLGLKATVHVDQYDSSSIDYEIAEYDARRIKEKPYARHLDDARFGASSTYGWSEDKFRQYSDVQRADFAEYIRGQGFKLE